VRKENLKQDVKKKKPKNMSFPKPQNPELTRKSRNKPSSLIIKATVRLLKLIFPSVYYRGDPHFPANAMCFKNWIT